jgi:hypothetical protein
MRVIYPPGEGPLMLDGPGVKPETADYLVMPVGTCRPIDLGEYVQVARAIERRDRQHEATRRQRGEQ